MTLIDLTARQKQIVVIALVELRRRRPDLRASITDMIGGQLAMTTCANELDRLQDELGQATSRTLIERVEALEQSVADLLLAVIKLEGPAIAAAAEEPMSAPGEDV